MTKLGDAQKNAMPPAKATALAAALSGAQHFEDIAIMVRPGVTVMAKMTLVGSATMIAIEAQALKAMEDLGFEQNHLTAGEYELERQKRLLAAAVFDATDPSQAFGTVEEWGALATEFLIDAFRQYTDMRERVDPIAVPLTEDEKLEIRAAVVKKNGTSLRSFGAKRLSLYLLTSDVPPASSPTPTFTSSDTSPDT